MTQVASYISSDEDMSNNKGFENEELTLDFMLYPRGDS